MASPDVARNRFKTVVPLKGPKHVRQFAVRASQDLLDGRGQIVKQDACRHPAKKLEQRRKPVQETNRIVRRKRHSGLSVAVGKGQRQVVARYLPAPVDGPELAKVHLGCAGRMLRRTNCSLAAVSIFSFRLRT